MKVFLPFRGEFGFIVMSHAPQVAACHEPKMVCCETGNEALYPGAVRYFLVERRRDDLRRQKAESDLMERTKEVVLKSCGAACEFVRPNHGAPREYFVPRPVIDYGIDCDLVVTPRRRAYGPDKNWPHWQRLIDLLAGEGRTVFAAGAPDSSFPVRCPGRARRAWDYPRFLDATIAAMLSAAVVIATDCGLAHLAVLCGRPLILISYRDGLVAPGMAEGKPYWPIMMKRFERENHRQAPITVVPHTWEDPEKVASEALRIVD